MPIYDDRTHDHMINHPPHHHHHHHHGDDAMRIPYTNRWAPCNDDQIPAINQVGRGLAGNSFIVKPKNDGNCEEYYLQGYSVDGATGEEHLEWESRNISGGWLHDLNHTYRVRPWNDPPTFNMTFIYHKPTCCSWSWTTPAIPYCWDEKGPYPEKMVGTGVATLFIRTDSVDHDEQVGAKGNPKDDQWIEKLIYPEHTTRENFNAPDPLEEWTVNLTFGLLHGDVLVPNLYDLADILGWKANNLYNIVDGQKGQLNGSDNVKDYIDDQFGFYDGDVVLPGADGDVSAKDYMDWWFNFILNRISSPGLAKQYELEHACACQLFTDKPQQNNWTDAELKLGGSWLVYPSLGIMFLHFVYRTAINNGNGKDEQGRRIPFEDDTLLEGENHSLVDLSAMAHDHPEISAYWPSPLLEDKVFKNIARVTVTAGGGQAYLGSGSAVQSADLAFDYKGTIRIASGLFFSPYIHPLLYLGNAGPHVSEWDVTIEATLFIALNDEWNPKRPWEEKYKGYDDPFGHPSLPPKEMFKDLYTLGTRG